MQATLEITGPAEAELETIVAFLLTYSRPAAERFADEFEAATTTLRLFPFIGVARGTFRWFRIDRTGYGLFYEVESNVVRIVAVRHARDPRPFG